MSKVYDPSDSRVGPEALAAFLGRQLTGDLSEVPGVGDATIEIFAGCDTVLDSTPGEVRIKGVTSTFGLIGVFMCFKNAVNKDGTPREVGPIEHAQRFYDWLCHIGTPAGRRAGIVDSMGQKINIAFPGIYDPTLFEVD